MKLLSEVKSRLRRWSPQQPKITDPAGTLPLEGAKSVFVIVCGSHFKQDVPSAGTTYRLGLARGFEQLGIPYRLVSAFDLERELEALPNPICFLSGFDYQYLSRSSIQRLKSVPHFVWVSPWFKGEVQFYNEHALPDLSEASALRRSVLSSDPAFLFTPVTESGHRFYEEWVKAGATLITLPLACDTTLYAGPAEHVAEFDGVEMAFVGGYWPYKAKQFDRYLKPYEKRLTVYGYSPWPYAGYGGQISIENEPALLRQARLVPAINEPHAELMGGDICERVFKVLGSGGMCVTDATAAHRDIFAPDELLVPRDLADYHRLVNAVFSDDALCREYREKGRAAVLSRHTYVHRARRILEMLD